MPKRPWWNTSGSPCARSTVTTSPTKSSWSPVRWQRVRAALEPRHAAVDQRRLRPPEPIAARRRSGRRAAGRIAARGRSARCREHVHGIALGVLEGGEARRAAREAPQHQRRVERHGVERVGREADGAAVGAARADDGDAGGELRERIAELAFVEGRRGVGGGTAGEGHRRARVSHRAHPLPVAATPCCRGGTRRWPRQTMPGRLAPGRSCSCRPRWCERRAARLRPPDSAPGAHRLRGRRECW